MNLSFGLRRSAVSTHQGAEWLFQLLTNPGIRELVLNCVVLDAFCVSAGFSAALSVSAAAAAAAVFECLF